MKYCLLYTLNTNALDDEHINQLIKKSHLHYKTGLFN